MSSDMDRYQRFRETVPQFFAQVEQVFGFLETKYRYRLHSQIVTDLEFLPDTYARVSFVGLRVEVRVWWYFYDAQMGVSFHQLEVPRLSAEHNSKGEALSIDLWTLASFRGHPDDPDFLLRHKEPAHSANVKQHLALIYEREEIIYTNILNVLEGLARATNHYAGAIVRGSTSMFPDVHAYHIRKLNELAASLR